MAPGGAGMSQQVMSKRARLCTLRCFTAHTRASRRWLWGAVEGDVRLVNNVNLPPNWVAGTPQVFFEGSWSQVRSYAHSPYPKSCDWVSNGSSAWIPCLTLTSGVVYVTSSRAGLVA